MTVVVIRLGLMVSVMMLRLKGKDENMGQRRRLRTMWRGRFDRINGLNLMYAHGIGWSKKQKQFNGNSYSTAFVFLDHPV